VAYGRFIDLEKANNTKHSKTKLPWSSRLLRRSAQDTRRTYSTTLRRRNQLLV